MREVVKCGQVIAGEGFIFHAISLCNLMLSAPLSVEMEAEGSSRVQLQPSPHLHWAALLSSIPQSSAAALLSVWDALLP